MLLRTTREALFEVLKMVTETRHFVKAGAIPLENDAHLRKMGDPGHKRCELCNSGPADQVEMNVMK